MAKAGLKQPLLIGGATTSRMHTAVKIAPQYSNTDHPVIHVLDASRSVTVVSALLDVDTSRREGYVADIADQYEELREEHYAALEDRKYLTLAQVRTRAHVAVVTGKSAWPISSPSPNGLPQARSKAPRFDWAAIARPVPGTSASSPLSHTVPWAPLHPGRTIIDGQDLATLLPYVDWTPFFATWELRGKYPNRGYPKIFDDADVGAEARKLFDDAQGMLRQMIDEKWVTARGVVGIYPANSVGDDVLVWAAEHDGSRPADAPAARFCMLRQQAEKETDEPYLALSDFVAPAGSSVRDYMGAFAVAIHGGEAQLAAFAADHDDYRKIMLQALMDRLAEAFAEQVHARMRSELWGYAPGEALDYADLLKVKYQGIRPAPGYPSQPDHTEKRTMWSLLDAEAVAGIKLTESLAMWPASAVSALVFAAPQSSYFAVGKIGPDQVNDYAARKGWATPEAEKWLAPVLNYDRA